MNKYYFHFGDYYGDGHRQYVTICLQSPKTREEIQNIITKICFKHPSFDNWDTGLANNYENSHIGDIAWDEIIELGYPYERLGEMLDDIEFDNYSGWEDLKSHYQLSDIYINIELIVDIWIFVMNYYGAEFEKMIDDSNHFDFGYGYGCFD